MTKPLALREWRYPKTYRTIFARELRSIYQADVMVLKPLWDHIFHQFEIYTKYRPKDYALVCIDVFSRYVWIVAMDNEKFASIAAAMLKIFDHMGIPKILQGDKKIIDSFKKKLSSDFPGITLFTTKLHETNKNAIVERVIRTLKNDILKYIYVRGFPEIRGNLLAKNILKMTPPPKFFKKYVICETTPFIVPSVKNPSMSFTAAHPIDKSSQERSILNLMKMISSSSGLYEHSES
jgi:transposase InsO family protein